MVAELEEAQSLQPVGISVVLKTVVQRALRAGQANMVDVRGFNQRPGEAALFYRPYGPVTSPTWP